MTKKPEKTLSSDYFHFIFIVSSILIIVYAWISWLNLNKLESQYKTDLTLEFNSIDQEITQNFDYINYITGFIENQMKYIHADINQISKLFRSLESHVSFTNLPSITIFSWAGLDKKIIVSSKLGVHTKPIDISYRKATSVAYNNPGKLMFDRQTYGIISGKRLIPAIKAIKNFSNEIIGFINVGLSVDGLAGYIEKAVDINKISYLVLSEGGEIVLQSTKGEEKISRDYFADQFVSNKLPKHLKYNDFTYDIVEKSSRYPFIIAVGYKPNILWSDVKDTLKLQVIPFAIMGLLFAVVLFEFKHRIFKPLFSLSYVVNEISKGNINVNIPKYETYEINNFANHLRNIKKYIHEIIEIEEKLREAKNEAEEAYVAKSQFLANVSHELRTPLFTISGYAEVIKEKIHGSVKQEYVDSANYIYNAGQHLLELINDILDTTKAESGSIWLYERRVNVKQVALSALELIEYQAKTKNIKVKFNIDKGIKDIFADGLRIKQILINLLSNAAKFTFDNGNIELNIHKDSKYIYFDVIDDGIGVAKQDIATILQDFGQVRHAFVRESDQGTGLGLPLSMKLAKLHGGDLIFESEEGKGSKVTVKIPIKRLI